MATHGTVASQLTSWAGMRAPEAEQPLVALKPTQFVSLTGADSPPQASSPCIRNAHALEEGGIANKGSEMSLSLPG